MSNPKISIIIPVYNHAKKLAQCLQSIKNQTFQDYEIIVVNDGSTDVTHDVLCRGVLQYAPTAKCIHQPNQGAPIARNNGFTQSTGQYVLFCDADVVMKPAMLEKMARVLDENPTIFYVYSSFKFGWKKFKLWEFDSERLKQMPYIHTTSLIRREHFPGFNPVLKKLQDWDLWLSMLEQGHVGAWIDEVLFTVKSGGTMSKWLPSFIVKLGIGKTAREYRQAVEIIKKNRQPRG